MIATKNLSLVEQKKLQWAKERGENNIYVLLVTVIFFFFNKAIIFCFVLAEELVGLCGLWGRPRNNFGQIDRNDQSQFFRRTNLLPPIPGKNSEESVKEYRLEEESETSGYLSDSPKHSKKEEMPVEYQYLYKNDETLRNGEVCGETPPNYWSELDKANNYWAEKKMYKNYKNENWNQQNSDFSVQNPRRYQNNKNHCYGTPDSVSSDDGSRLRWGDRGVGIGHLWDPVINPPDCRLPQVSDHYRQTPKWVEKGLKNCDEGKAEILVINHPDDEQFDFSVQKNYILGQNAPILPEEMEERERKRKKALEHQNAIKKQLEEREFKRKQEREKRIREEKLEEERIKKEQEIERLRYEEEQRRMKQKEEIDKKREEVMKEAIEQAEKRAREDKKRNKRHIVMDQEQKTGSTNNEKLVKSEKPQQPTDIGLTQRKQNKKGRKPDEFDNSFDENKEKDKKVLKDSSSQFEEIQLSNSFQLLNVNGLPVDGGLALMLENSPQENNFILSPEGVQLALLMSPRNANSTNRLIPLSPSFSDSVDSAERTLTPSKYRITARSRFNPRNKSTQTDFRSISSWIKSGSAGKRRRLSIRCGTKTGSVTVPQK